MWLLDSANGIFLNGINGFQRGRLVARFQKELLCGFKRNCKTVQMERLDGSKVNSWMVLKGTVRRFEKEQLGSSKVNS